ncbi:uncharacterized protein LOC111697257 [Eurytemora carolleeae]|uniref:uncharacterized protein LOC111697257 n=1 Tax=Eurytemora carolleeae TaxID=1294199 RepID=UPI000C7751F2|nr:uncharacterized protein LOC111697257 [Eurytemora carolleeae]|eukprot:XP_023322957.1 uncharacterized protein LOC111697257 [Eurytemora affinis]
MEAETLEVEQRIKLVFKKLKSNLGNLGSSEFSYSPVFSKTPKEASKAKGRVGTKRSRSIDVKNDVSPVPSKKIKTLNPGNEKSSDPVSTVQERTSAKNERLVRPSKHRPSSTSKHTSRTKRCEECEGCTRLDCGTCQSCRINHQFKHQIKIGRAECLKKVCTNPIPLTYQLVKEKTTGGTIMSSLMQEQDDAACPFKMIDGQLYDFRCVFCKKLPRAGMANRSELYRHYSLYHFSAELMEEFKNLTRCPVPGCNKVESGKKMADHMGQVHNEVEKYIPVENRIPLKKPASRSGGKGRAAKKVVEYIFPEIPPGYNPATRTVKIYIY